VNGEYWPEPAHRSVNRLGLSELLARPARRFTRNSGPVERQLLVSLIWNLAH
jgi:hypothetical protein